MPVRLYDRATRKPVDFATGEDAARAVASGAAAPVAKEAVPVIGADGTKGTVAGDQLYALIASGGRPLTGEEAKEAKLEAKYGTLGSVTGTLNAAAAQNFAAARGATVGLSDKVIVEAAKLAGKGEQARSFLRDVRDLHPTSSVVSEVGGATAAALASGGGSAGGAAGRGAVGLARAAPEAAALARGGASGGAAVARGAAGSGLARMLPAAATDVIGSTVEGAVRGALPEATTALGRAANTGLAMGARGAVEGAIFGAGQEVSESTLRGDPELNAEKIYAAGLRGAALGAIVGGGAGFGGSLASSGAKGLAKTLAPKLSELAETQYVEAFARSPTLERQVEKVGKGKVGRFIADEGILPPLSRGADAVERASAASTKWGEAVGAMYAKADAAKWAAPTVESVAKKIGALEEVATFARAPNTYRPEMARIQGILDDLKVSNPKTFTEWQAFRNEVIVPRTKFDPSVSKSVNDAHKAIYGIINDSIVEAGDAAAAKAGASEKAFGALFRETNEKYRIARLVEDMAELTQERVGKNVAFGLRDVIAGAGGLATGDPIMGLATGVGSKLVRERGNATLGWAADRIAQLGAIQRAADAVDRKALAAVKGIVEGPKPTSRPLKTRAAQTGDDEPLAAKYRRARDAVLAAQADPEGAAARRAQRAAEIAPHAPLTAAALVAHEQRVDDYVAARLPRVATPPQAMLNRREALPREEEMRRFVALFDVRKRPDHVFDELRDGKIDRTKVEMLKLTHPQLFQQLRFVAAEEVARQAEGGKKWTLEERVRLSLTLDIPLDSSVQPETLRALQATYATQNQGGPPGSSTPPAAPRRPVQSPKPPQSAVDRIAAGESR